MKNILDQDEIVGSIEEPDRGPLVEYPPMVHYASLTDYERLYKPDELARAVFTMEDESVLIRRPFRWTKDGEQLPDAYASMELDQVCAQYGWKIVASYGHHFAIITPSAMNP